MKKLKLWIGTLILTLTCISITVLGQTQPKPGIYLSNYRAKKIIVQLEERDMFKNLYELKLKENDTLRVLVNTKDLIIKDLKEQNLNYKEIYSNSSQQTNNLIGVINSNNKELSKTNKILYGTIAIIVTVLLLRK